MSYGCSEVLDYGRSHEHCNAVTTLKERLDAVRKEKGWSQRELARQAGLKSETHVGNFMRGSQPRGDNAKKIARALGVNLDWLVSGEGPRDPAPAKTEERYHAMPAVRMAAAAQGFPKPFIDAWEPQLDADEQPDFNTLWSMFQADFARAKGKARGDRRVDDDKDL